MVYPQQAILSLSEDPDAQVVLDVSLLFQFVGAFQGFYELICFLSVPRMVADEEVVNVEDHKYRALLVKV